MPEHLRALTVILVLATIFFALAQRSVSTITEPGIFSLRRNLWFGLTLAAFIGPNFWIYILIAIPLLMYANHHDFNPPALFFFLLFVLPVAYIQIPGPGIINFIFDLSHARLLELIILLPAFFRLMRQGDNVPFGKTWPDKALAAYLILLAVLFFRDSSLTHSMRQIFYLFIDIFLPYFVISRSLKNMQVFREVLLSLVMAIMVLAPLAIIELYKHWLLYSSVTDTLKLEEGMTGYLARDGMLRAIVTAGQPIVLGYLMVIGIGIYLFLQRSIQQKIMRRLGLLLLVAGLIAPLSRGPWVGAVVLVVVFIASGRHYLRRLLSLALVAMLIIFLLAILPGGEKVINLFPFVGSTEKENVEYRENLITNSMIVIQRNPWFGSVDFINTPEMEAMRQGEGIVDIVNIYIRVALETGLVGLGLFVSFFVLTLSGIYRAIHSISHRDSEEYLLGRVLFATLVSILVIIFTVSRIMSIPLMYWSVAAMGVAYAQMVRKNIALTQERLS